MQPGHCSCAACNVQAWEARASACSWLWHLKSVVCSWKLSETNFVIIAELYNYERLESSACLIMTKKLRKIRNILLNLNLWKSSGSPPEGDFWFCKLTVEVIGVIAPFYTKAKTDLHGLIGLQLR